MQEIIVGLDIGTTKVCAIVAERDTANDSLAILGIGEAPSEGLNRGVVVNIDKTVNSILNAVQQAQMQSGVIIRDVIVGIAGDHIESFKTTGIVTISHPDRDITKSDVTRLLEETRKISLPADRKILHVIPQEFIIDGQDGITDPVGMSGTRMSASVHVVTALVTATRNIYRCVERAGLRVRDIVLEPLADSYSVLDEEEKEIGVALIDIGGGTTDIALFENGIIRHTSVFGIAGRQVTDDIRKGLGIIAGQAERVKQEFGHCHPNSIMQDDIFMIPGVGGRRPMEVSKSLLCQIIQPRMEELLEFAYAEIRRSGYESALSAGIVLTGGGSLIRGIEDVAEEIFGSIPVKIGIPLLPGFSGLAPEIENPRYSTGVGLIRYGLQQQLEPNEFIPDDEIEEKVVSEQPDQTEISYEIPQESTQKVNIFTKMKGFFENL